MKLPCPERRSKNNLGMEEGEVNFCEVIIVRNDPRTKRLAEGESLDRLHTGTLHPETWLW